MHHLAWRFDHHIVASVVVRQECSHLENNYYLLKSPRFHFSFAVAGGDDVGLHESICGIGGESLGDHSLIKCS